ncbi:MAG: hypothetical protein H6747_12565 [Deltaproteobacteria bacterium]|nr:hypothetical protein [Deltaproteobacteria bacterium]
MQLAAAIARWLEEDAVLVLADARHPAHRFPERPGDPADVLRLLLLPGDPAETHDPEALLARIDDRDQEVPVRIAWDAIFFAGRRMAPGRAPERLFLPERIPPCFGPEREINAERMIEQMGFGAKVPGMPEWSIRVDGSVLADDADRSAWCADKAEALRRLVIRPTGLTWLLLDGSIPGVQLPDRAVAPPIAVDGAMVMVGVLGNGPHGPPSVGVDALRWRLPDGGEGCEIVVPWRALGAAQEAQTAQGWWWPRDLPEQVRAQLARDAAVWAALERAEGIPLSPAAPPAQRIHVLDMQPQLPADPGRAIIRLRRLGVVLVLADAHAPGIELGGELPGRARIVMVPMGLPGLDPHFHLGDDRFSAMMPDHAGKVVKVRIPYHAVLLVTAQPGGRTASYPDHFPEFLVTAQHALHAKQNSGGAALPTQLDVFDRDPNGDGLGLGLELLPDGQYSLVISQPVGTQPAPPGSPEGTKGRLLMNMSFRLPPPLLN